MHRANAFALAFLLATGEAAAQTAPADTQLTQALLTEIRGLRQDLQTMATTIQRVQLIMFRVQSQTALTSRATQRLEDTRNRCANAQRQHKSTATRLEELDQKLRSGTLSPADQRSVSDAVSQMKANSEMWANEEAQCQASEAEAEGQYRIEQTRMAELQDQLDKLDKALESLGKH